jgi:hypothetical protein
MRLPLLLHLVAFARGHREGAEELGTPGFLKEMSFPALWRASEASRVREQRLRSGVPVGADAGGSSVTLRSLPKVSAAISGRLPSSSLPPSFARGRCAAIFFARGDVTGCDIPVSLSAHAQRGVVHAS